MGGNRVCYPYSCATLWHLMWHFCHMWWIFHGCICWSQMVMSPWYDGSIFFYHRWLCPLDMRLYICWSQMVMSPWYDSFIFFLTQMVMSPWYDSSIYFITWLCPLDMILYTCWSQMVMSPWYDTLYLLITDGYVPLIW